MCLKWKIVTVKGYVSQHIYHNKNMKKLLFLICMLCTITQTFAVEQRRIDVIDRTASQFKKENHWDWSCKIWNESFDIATIIKAKSRNESYYWENWLWRKYNNWWNLKYARSSPLPKQSEWTFVHGDWWEYYSYKSVEDWLYDMMERQRRRGNWTCHLTRQSTFNYLKWPNNKRTPTNISDVNQYYNSLLRNAKEVRDAWYDTTDVAEKENVVSKPPQHTWRKKTCTLLYQWNSKDKIIQADTMQWKYIFEKQIEQDRIKIFLCNKPI